MSAHRERLPGYTPIFLRLRDLKDVARLEDALPAEFARRRFPVSSQFFGVCCGSVADRPQPPDYWTDTNQWTWRKSWI